MTTLLGDYETRRLVREAYDHWKISAAARGLRLEFLGILASTFIRNEPDSRFPTLVGPFPLARELEKAFEVKRDP